MSLLVDSARACRLYYNSAVQNEASGILVRSKLSAIAQRMGFAELKREHMALVASEMVSNLVKHASGRGIVQIWQQPGPVLDILALDYGPGITNLKSAQEDGYSSSNTLGKGLGSIQRLADEVHIYTRPAPLAGTARRWSGTAVLARFRLAKDKASQGGPGMGFFVRALSDERHNGDHFYLQSSPEGLRWLHLDGLGHGEGAERATSNLERHLHAPDDLPAILGAVDRQLAGGRGAVAVLGQIGWSPRELHLLGVGDMQAYLMQGDRIQSLSFPPGVLGKEHKGITPLRFALEDKALVITTTDGIRRNWDENSFPGLFHAHPQLIAYVLGNIMGRISDDQSLCVVRLP